MIQTVIKRDGRVVGFNEEKIKAAIRKAMIHTELGEDESLINRITDRMAEGLLMCLRVCTLSGKVAEVTAGTSLD